MLNKLIDESYKIFCLMDHGYIFDFRFASYTKKTPSIENTDSLNNTSAIPYCISDFGENRSRDRPSYTQREGYEHYLS